MVGRSSELETLCASVERAPKEGGAWFAVVGEAGIGKTRLVSEFAGACLAAGAGVVSGRCSLVDRSTAYRPFAEASLALSASVPVPVPLGLAPYAAVLARFVPAWRDGARVASESPAVLGESLLRLLRWYGAGGPAVLIIEDLHWADDGTLAVCAYLADHVAEQPTVVVATWRPDEAGIANALAGPQAAARRLLTLGTLAPAEVADMAAACLGGPAPIETLNRLARASNGLPLLIEDLLDEGAPDRFANLVAERLRRLSASARRAVVAAAMLGEHFELPLLACALGSEEAVISTMDEAIGAGLVVADGGGPRFRHALTHEVVLAAAPSVRAAVTGPVAVALESAGSARDLARAAQLRADAGQEAAAIDLYERAAGLVDREGTPDIALALLDRAAALSTDRATRLRIDKARLGYLASLGRTEEVETLGNRLLDAVSGDDERTVRLILARCSLDSGRADQAAAHLDAVHRAGPGAAVLLVLRARLMLLSGGVDRRLAAEHLARQALGTAMADAATRCEALDLAARCARSRSLDDAAALLRRAVPLAEDAGLTSWRLRLLNELGTVEMLRSADGARLERVRGAALAAGALDVAVGASVNLAALYAMRGELDACQQEAQAAHEDALRLGLRALAAAARVMLAISHGFVGDRDAMERHLRAAHTLSPSDRDLEAFAWAVGRGLCALVREERADAIAALSRAVLDDAPVGSLDSARPPLLLLRALSGEATVDDRHAARATATPGAGWSNLWLGYADAVLAGRRGDRQGAEDAFARGDEAGQRHPLFRAIGLRLVAEASLDDGWGDPVQWLRQAEAVFVAGGQTRIASACRGLLRKAGAPSARRRGADRTLSDGLLRAGVTAREAEVLALVGEHLPNREIAARLYLSPRTIEKHVASLLMKLAVSDRAALSRVAVEHLPPRMGA